MVGPGGARVLHQGPSPSREDCKADGHPNDPADSAEPRAVTSASIDALKASRREAL